jgi:DNA polymerase I
LTPEQKAYLDEAVAAVAAADTYALDYETTGFNPFSDKITGFSVAVDTELVPSNCVYGCCGPDVMIPKAWYFQFVPELLDHLTYEQVQEKYATECYPVRATYKAFLPSFTNKKKKAILHNGKFDFKFGTRAGVPNDNILIDTAIAAWLLDENRMSQKLKDLVKSIFKHKMVKFEELGGLFSPKIELYGADDAAQTLRLWRHFEPMIEEQGLTKVLIESECRVSRALAAMELEGAFVDIDLITDMDNTVNDELDQVEQDIYRQAAEEWNKKAPKDEKVETIEFDINSKQSVANVLFKRLKWKVPEGSRSEKTGQPSVAKKVLKRFENRKPIAKSLLRYSELYKIATGYTRPIRRAANLLDGRIRGQFNQIQHPRGGGGTVTGRLSASKDDDLGGVNLQTIPSRSDTGKKIRYMFIAPEGRVLICLDYSQIELRFLAHMSRDPLLVEAYCSWDCVDCGASGSTAKRQHCCPECKAPEGHHKFEKGCKICVEGQAKTGCPKHGFVHGKDVHQLTADQVGCTRSAAKTINFAVIYGTGPAALAEQIGSTLTEAYGYLDDYFKKYKGVELFAESICQDLSRRGYVTTILKRRRRIPRARRRRITKKDREWRSAMSARVQGSAADLMKVAIRNIHERLLREGLDAFLILTVHDEVTVECAEEIKEEVYQIMQEEMENCFPLRVPVIAEGGWGRTWAEAK